MRDSFLLEGEGPEALVPGTARRRALDAALQELDGGGEAPSISWRREFSLMLGLERLLATEPPTLLDGAELNEHQVDALSGTLAALIAEQEETANGGNGNGRGAATVEALAEAPLPSGNGVSAEAEDEDEEARTREDGRGRRRGRGRGRRGRD